ncbi:hypothetical protein DASB73_004650 [Starmerella bacillaris]|uniref:Uncharacterized protein n=1 Tax=Starmerella bacillaris TaxID=1247836 RepID=A0AAV5REW0_STABA|nr:hypothetical protein DASB73_004650 [Starmerella bacillaris]
MSEGIIFSESRAKSFYYHDKHLQMKLNGSTNDIWMLYDSRTLIYDISKCEIISLVADENRIKIDLCLDIE